MKGERESLLQTLVKRRATTKVAATINHLLYSKFEGNPSTEWGINQEAATNLQYLQIKREVSPDISTCQTGLVISLDNPWLAASHDGLVYDHIQMEYCSRI